MTLQILLVDDEPLVTRGLERMLRRQIDWEIQAAENGEDAQRILEQAKVDVVLSDMRMPGMSGVQLLTAIRDRWPGVGRVILSGQSQHDTTLQSADVAHRYLAKPCEPAVLRQAVASIARAQECVCAQGLQEAGGRLSGLPVLRSTHEALGALLDDSSRGMDDVLALAQRDPGFAARVMQLSSSAVFGASRVPRTLPDGISALRLDTLQDLHDAGRLCWSLDAEDEERTELAALAMECGMAAMEHQLEAIDAGQDDYDIERAFTRGLLSLSGKIGFAAVSPATYAGAKDSPEALEAAFGAPYRAFGSYLLYLWGVSEGCDAASVGEPCPLRASA